MYACIPFMKTTPLQSGASATPAFPDMIITDADCVSGQSLAIRPEAAFGKAWLVGAFIGMSSRPASAPNPTPAVYKSTTITISNDSWTDQANGVILAPETHAYLLQDYTSSYAMDPSHSSTGQSPLFKIPLPVAELSRFTVTISCNGASEVTGGGGNGTFHTFVGGLIIWYDSPNDASQPLDTWNGMISRKITTSTSGTVETISVNHLRPNQPYKIKRIESNCTAGGLVVVNAAEFGPLCLAWPLGFPGYTHATMYPRAIPIRQQTMQFTRYSPPNSTTLLYVLYETIGM